MDTVSTSSQTVGPYFHLGLTDRRTVGRMANAETQGERISLTCRVLDGQGVPVPDAMIELWQANAAGKYAHPEDTQQKALEPSFLGFGRLPTEENGTCTFETIKPGPIPGPNGTTQAPHINVSVFSRGLLMRLPTRLYFAEHSANLADPVLNLVPESRRITLMAQPHVSRQDSWLFDIHLSGDRETVFFDV